MSSTSTEGYELVALPLETIIGNESSKRNSIQSDTSFKSTSKGIGELRKKFETFLSQDELKESFECNVQKLIFLDHFYDCRRKKAIQFKEQSKINRSAFDWFATQEKLNEPKQAKQDETLMKTHEDDQLEMLVYMFSNHFRYMFYYFQKTESKFVKQWMKQNLSSLPKFILDDLKVKLETRQSLRELLAYKENELNSSAVLDADFDFLNFLSTNTGDWKLLSKMSKVSDIQVYTSKENYMSTPTSKILKMVYNVDISIEEFTKAYLSYQYPKETSFREYSEYEPLVSNNSSRKYSLVKGKFIIESKIPLLKGRNSDAVYTSKPKFIGNKLVETMELFKTTSTLKDNKKCIAIGGTIIRKIDETKCQLVQMAMIFLSGIFQTDLILETFALKYYAKQIRTFIERVMSQTPNNSNNPKLLWKSFCDYCTAFHNIDAENL